MTATGYVSTNGDPRKVDVAGDTMTGDLVLPDSSPDTALSAASRGYVDATVADLLPLTGGTVTGDLTVEDANLVVDSTGTAINGVDRGSTSAYAAYALRTAGVDRWAWQMSPGSQDLHLVDSANGAEVLRVTPGVTPAVTFTADVTFAGAGGGGGTTVRTVDERITAGDVTLPSAGSWAIATSGSTPLAASITAAVGDRIQASPSFMRAGGGSFLDLAILNSAGTISRYLGTDSASPLLEGHPAYYPQAASFPGTPGTMQIVVGSGEVDGSGKATIALVYQGTGGETVYASATYPFYLLLTNIGGEPA
ncbi:hypothetical protein ABZT03_38855 [Streptomyces sp. NPDC005574]|uniref:hypothetical protein n=1 Tax=Streptomyces sp. NPDC005574 TaxID=3156891 RepID=UPI0033BACF81